MIDNVEAKLRFNKESKLIKTDEFSSVFNFRKRIATKYLVIHYQPNTFKRPRLGLVVGKKVAKLAIQRNYMRRVLRELFRIRQHEMNHLDWVIRVPKKFDRTNYEEIQKEFASLVCKVNQRTQSE